MASWEKLLAKAKAGPHNLTFRELCRLLEKFGFTARPQAGTSHVSFKHPKVPEVLTVQRGKHGKAKAWQVKLLLNWIESYELDTSD